VVAVAEVLMMVAVVVVEVLIAVVVVTISAAAAAEVAGLTKLSSSNSNISIYTVPHKKHTKTCSKVFHKTKPIVIKVCMLFLK